MTAGDVDDEAVNRSVTHLMGSAGVRVLPPSLQLVCIGAAATEGVVWHLGSENITAAVVTARA